MLVHMAVPIFIRLFLFVYTQKPWEICTQQYTDTDTSALFLVRSNKKILRDQCFTQLN